MEAVGVKRTERPAEAQPAEGAEAKKKAKQKPAAHDVQVTQGGKTKKYAAYIEKALGLTGEAAKTRHVVISASDKLVVKAISIAEVVKRKHPSLLQECNVTGMKIEITLKLPA